MEESIISDKSSSPKSSINLYNFRQPTIFNKNILKTPKLIPSNVMIDDVGDVRYFPAASKE